MPKKEGYKYRSFFEIAERINRKSSSSVENPFVLLLGPSGVGKSTIINALNAKSDDKFAYVSPYTTRPLRDGEVDKVHVSPSEFETLRNGGEFIYVKELYGNRYGTPLTRVLEIQSNGQVPILDFPLSDVDKLQLGIAALSIISVYIFPETIMDWYERLRNIGRMDFSRLRGGFYELRTFQKADDALSQVRNIQHVAHSVVNSPGGVNQAAIDLLTFLNAEGIVSI